VIQDEKKQQPSIGLTALSNPLLFNPESKAI